MARGECSSCGDDDVEGLVAVRRLYVTPSEWGEDEVVTEVESVELWCVPCRTHYPHRQVDEPPSEATEGA